MSVLESDLKGPRFIGFPELMQPLEAHMNALDAYLMEQVECFEPEVQGMVRYALEHRGKRIRPMLVFYAGWQLDGGVSCELVRVAAALEMIHLATLVHDDVLDEARLRHNCLTVGQKYGVKEAILLGDALFAHSLKLSADFPTVDVCQRVTECARNVCTGEIVQTFHRGERDFSKENYFRVINLKTAELFSVACELGARIGGYPEDYIKDLAEYGRLLGTAYQIFDDLADIWGSEAKIGKTLGTDLLTGKWTLPMIYYYEQLAKPEQEELLVKMEKGCVIDIDSLGASMADSRVFEAVLSEFDAQITKTIILVKRHEASPSYDYLIHIKDLMSGLPGGLGM